MEQEQMLPKEKNDLVDALRLAIMEADTHLVTNDKLLPERELSAALGVGRRSLRKALNTLEGEGLLFRKQGQGTFIREVSTKTTSIKSLTNRTSPQDIIEVRQEIEPILAGLAAVRATQIEIDQMKHFVRRFQVPRLHVRGQHGNGPATQCNCRCHTGPECALGTGCYARPYHDSGCADPPGRVDCHSRRTGLA